MVLWNKYYILLFMHTSCNTLVIFHFTEVGSFCFSKQQCYPNIPCILFLTLTLKQCKHSLRERSCPKFTDGSVVFAHPAGMLSHSV